MLGVSYALRYLLIMVGVQGMQYGPLLLCMAVHDNTQQHTAGQGKVRARRRQAPPSIQLNSATNHNN